MKRLAIYDAVKFLLEEHKEHFHEAKRAAAEQLVQDVSAEYEKITAGAADDDDEDETAPAGDAAGAAADSAKKGQVNKAPAGDAADDPAAKAE